MRERRDTFKNFSLTTKTLFFSKIVCEKNSQETEKKGDEKSNLSKTLREKEKPPKNLWEEITKGANKKRRVKEGLKIF